MNRLGSLNEFALFYPEIKDLLRKKDYEGLKRILEKLHPVDIAENFSKFSKSEFIIIFKLLSHEKACEVFENLSPEIRKELLSSLDSNNIKTLIEDMESDERADLFGELSEELRRNLYSLIKEEDKQDIKKLLSYPEDTAGGIMSTDFITLNKDMKAKEALLHIQRNGFKLKAQNLYAVYVVDENGKLIGGVSLKSLLTASPEAKIEDIMKPVALIKINVNVDREEVARIFRKYDLLCAPVVDDNNVLVGIITVDDIMDVMSEEAGEDIYGLGKISEADELAQINYSEVSIPFLVRARIPWLFILLLIGTFVSGRILKGYSTVLEKIIILSAFIPMLMDSGGNVGQQALSLMVRALALKQVTLKDVLRVIWKEIRVGVLIGSIMGIVAFGATQILGGFNLKLGITVALTLLLVITAANLTGTVLPFVFTFLGLDPAVAASPFITTVVDATALILYFEIAKMLLGI